MINAKKGLLALFVLGCVPTLSACTFSNTLKLLWNSEEAEKGGSETSKPENSSTKPVTVDTNIEKPSLSESFGQTYDYSLNGTAEAMTVEASVSDGGTLSYQWYRNNVDSNGGGTLIPDAVDSSFTPPTDKAGTSFYYVVVTNTIGESVQYSVSYTNRVNIAETEEAGEEASAAGWQDADGQWWYVREDGSYPVSQWENIGDTWYVFNENGYVVTGWYTENDKWYYLDESGAMLHDTEVEGYTLGPDGVMQ